MSFDLAALARAIAAHGPVVRVVVAEARGSAPREPGASMVVWASGFDGTIGGGALEFEALAEARRRLSAGVDGAAHYPLGPALAQCCGGAATLAYERWDDARLRSIAEGPLFARPLGPACAPPLAIARALRGARGGAPDLTYVPGDPPWLAEPMALSLTPLWIWGAGHVGRALVRVFEGLPFDLTWIDAGADRFPDPIPRHARALPVPHPADATGLAPAQAAHLVLTYSHALDLEICHRLLARGDFARLGLIGSASKSARFRARLRALGHDETRVSRLECPIGLAGPAGLRGGKAPAEIAVSVAADHLQWRASRGVARRSEEAL